MQAPEVAVDMAVAAADANPIPSDGRSGGEAENHVHPPMVMWPPPLLFRQEQP